MPAVSVIVPARDASATLPDLLTALELLEAVPGGFEVIVADDGSTDDTRAIAAAHRAVGTVVDTPGGAGPGAARNAAAAVAAGEFLAFTDADCAPDPGWLAALLAAFGEGADLVQGAVTPAGPTGPYDRSVTVGRLGGLFETANLAVRREWFERVGGFERWLRPRRSKELGEDVWLGWRLRRAGARVGFAPAAVVRHAVFPGDPSSFVAAHARLRFFPQMVRRIPELRTALLYRRVFLNARTAQFDLAVAGVIAQLAAGSPIPLLLALPYLRIVYRAARPCGRRAPQVAAARIAADIVGLGALLMGSVQARKVVL